MADDRREREVAPLHGNEWEVVSLTASAYAAAPEPEELETDDEFARRELGASQAMFLSDHFIFPPSEHENLPIEPECYKIKSELEVQEEYPPEGDFSGQDKDYEKDQNFKGLSEVDELDHITFFDKGAKLSGHGSDDTNKFVPFDEGDDVVEADDPLLINLEPPSNSSSLEHNKEERYNGCSSEAWWRRQAASLYAHAKEANTFWSIFVAAALMGLVIVGQRWQREKLPLQQSKWKIGNHDEKMHRVLGSINRFKDVFVGAQRRGLAGISSMDH